MKRIALFTLAALTVASVASAQTAVNPLAARTFYVNETAAQVFFSGSTTAGPPLPGCALTIRALGAIGHNDAGGHSMATGTIMVFGGQEILDALATEGPGAGLSFDITTGNDSTLQHTVQASLVTPEMGQVMFEGNGVFPAGGAGWIGNDAVNILAERESGILGSSDLVPTVGRCEPGTIPCALAPLDFNPQVSVAAGGAGGGTLSLCVSGSGNVRIIDAENNAGWATDCESHGGYRAMTQELGGTSPLVGAADAAVALGQSYTTYQASCAAAFGAPTAGATTVDNPVYVLFTQVEEASMDHWVQNAFGGDNWLFVQHAGQGASTVLVAD